DFSVGRTRSLPVQQTSLRGQQSRSRSLAVLNSVFHLATLNIPRHLYRFYLATFQTREYTLHTAADRSLNVAITWNYIQARLRNPICVAAIFVGVTAASDRLKRWPEAITSLAQSTVLRMLIPPFRIGIPLLSQCRQTSDVISQLAGNMITSVPVSRL
ncbi:hypothetical protein P879_03193, partial [Paragonimus westermani]